MKRDALSKFLWIAVVMTLVALPWVDAVAAIASRPD